MKSDSMEKTKPIVIPARKAGKCEMCGKEFAQGTRIVRERKTGHWVMADCLWPDKIRQRPMTTTESGSKEVVQVQAALAGGVSTPLAENKVTA